MSSPLRFDVVISGQALNDQGFVGFNTVSGVGLMTFGFVWPCQGIWGVADNPVTTTWVECVGYSGTLETCLD